MPRLPLFRDLDPGRLVRVGYVLTDIDDTLTSDGRLGAEAYAALELLRGAGLRIIPITGRPAGWCDLIARLWPVDAVVGENGAVWMRRDPHGGLTVRWWQDDGQRQRDRQRLDDLAGRILAAVPGTALASDQGYRACDLAIDVAEDVPPLAGAEIERVVAGFAAAGATAKVSSIHVNGWFGGWDKLAMTRRLLAEAFAEDPDAVLDRAVFVGDSPNDEPMFAAFPLSVGVANVARFLGGMASPPRFLASAPGGTGFAEVAAALLAARAQSTCA